MIFKHYYKILLILSLITSSCKNECGNGCPTWEICGQGYQDMFSTTYECKPILNKFINEYYGNGTVSFENFNNINSETSILLSRNDNDGTNTMNMQVSLNDSLILLNPNLTIVFVSENSGEFLIPAQTLYTKVYVPSNGNTVYTNVVYDGNGIVTDSESNNLNMNFNYTFFNQSANLHFIAY